MIRSLYSGVAGLKTQQTKMDVIGNNIANVGTYGFKSDRATFKDVYYQTTQTATASTGNTGGTNAKQIGYGNVVGSIDTNTKTSAMSSTGYGLDIAIAGEGFLQVMGADGNIMYTKAGMLDIDAEGNLVDVNGNFVLGVSGSDTTLPPSSNKIIIDLPYLDPQNSSVESTINQVDYTISSSNPTDKANVNFNFVSSNSLPIGQKMAAKISGDSITVTVNAKETFANAAEINAELNKAIKAANGNVEHPAGDFTISMVPEQS
ncbi:MAG: flagellar hook-basal body complex protein, partial [Oscillospiraceae bacterium]|nr:flagellar hook-basal body complex protein [Oscillospiraceae bacterium]